MRTTKINEIRGLLRSDPRLQPLIIYFSETWSIVNYRDRPSDFLNADDVKKLIELYPDVRVEHIGRPLEEWELRNL